ncbi:L,D-transpeptidase family protein [Mucilaginibacter lutimaris]|uniref:L,D-transpeptidase family protein n=1 Tax=Mucilaginibacter lutimaris TaxID=931629 RepID=A0ABW2ZDS9_9SPHI
MKTRTNAGDYNLYSRKANTLLLTCLFLIVMMLAVFVSMAAVKQPARKLYDKELSAEIEKQLVGGKLSLNFPASVKRFYTQRQFDANWLAKETAEDQTWAAMLMIDCVLQFGLNQADYHPKELLYSTLHDIFERPAGVPLDQQARFDIMLTDAMVSFANNLHFGKYNPQYPASKIDKGNLDFDALSLINMAMQSKDLMLTITGAQPQNKLYQDIQSRMHAIAGVQLGDCYEFPEADVRKMALNMERLRWATLDTDNYLQVNVPSYKLSFYHNGLLDTFRVIVGKPGNATPTLNSAVNYFTTAPEWKVPQKIFIKELLPKAIKDTAYLSAHHYSIYNDAGMLINPNKTYLLKIKQAPQRYRATQSAGCDNALGQVVFRFANIHDIYLHDTPEQELFYRKNRALSHGCVRVQYAAKLAKLMLENDGLSVVVPTMEKAIDRGIRKNFVLKKPVKIAVTYITCEIVNGRLVVYDDVYGLDKNLDMLLYKKDDQTLKVTQN